MVRCFDSFKARLWITLIKKKEKMNRKIIDIHCQGKANRFSQHAKTKYKLIYRGTINKKKTFQYR
jgi:hypothetical protein